jgi:hypothetical protein
MRGALAAFPPTHTAYRSFQCVRYKELPIVLVLARRFPVAETVGAP